LRQSAREKRYSEGDRCQGEAAQGGWVSSREFFEAVAHFVGGKERDSYRGVSRMPY
jgi:hypothetical protein